MASRVSSRIWPAFDPVDIDRLADDRDDTVCLAKDRQPVKPHATAIIPEHGQRRLTKLFTDLEDRPAERGGADRSAR